MKFCRLTNIFLYPLYTLLLSSVLGCGSSSNDPVLDFLSGTADSADQNAASIDQQSFDAMLSHGPKAFEAKGSFISSNIDSLSLTETSDANLVSFDTTEMPAIASVDLEKYFAKILSERVDPDDFSFEDLQPAKNFWTTTRNGLVLVNYNRLYRGTPVKDAFIEFTLSKIGDGYKLYQVYDHTYGPIKVENKLDTDPAKAPSLKRASADLNLNLKRASKKVEIHATEAQGELKFYYVDSIESNDERTNEPYVVNIAYGSNKVISAYKTIYTAKSKVNATVINRSHLDNQKIDLALPLASIEIDGQSMRTAADGSIDLPQNASNAKITLASSRVKVKKSGSRSSFSFETNLDSGATSTIRSEGDQLLAMNAYVSIQQANKFVRRYVTPKEVKLLDSQVDLTFSKNDSCNAYYQSGSDKITLFSKGNGCANMALVNDVIYHEWGHGLDQYTGRNGGITDGAFSEGIGDILAMLMTGSSNMGEGFFTSRKEGIRDLKNTKRYPRDRGESHSEGEIIGGAFWDMRESLIKRYGENRGSDKSAELFVRHLLTTDKYTDSLKTLLALDDDDQNPTTPSPNACLIKAAFANHGLASEEQCEDPIAKTSSIAIDINMYLGISDSGSVVASTKNKNVKKIALCEGSAKKCKSKKVSEMKILEIEGKKGAIRTFQGTAELEALQRYTMYGLNQAGTAISVREVKVASN